MRIDEPVKRTLYHATPAPWAIRDDPNYPGAPVEPATVARSTVRSQVDYDTFVNGYARRISGYTGMVFAGVAGIAGAVIAPVDYGTLLIIAGLGAIGAGGAGLLASWQSHNQWQANGYGVSMTETYAPRHDDPPANVRPFVPSANPSTISTGRLTFAPTVWQSLLDMALGNGGMLTRDIAMRAGVGREWYNTDPNAPGGYQALLHELRRLRFIDHRNRVTPEMLAWYAASFPALPLAAIGTRPAYDRPPGGATEVTDTP